MESKRTVLRLLAAVLSAAIFSSACASSKGRSSEDGFKVLEAVVTQREYHAPGSAEGGSFRGSGTWYLSFEARDGDRTVFYRFPVTQLQYYRYQEGTRVELLLAGDRLREIRPLPEPK